MPIIKSSSNDIDITVIIFDRYEIDALVTMLWNAKFRKTDDVKAAIEKLEEMFYALGIPYPPE